MRLASIALTAVTAALIYAAPANAAYTADVNGADAYVQGDGSLTDSLWIGVSGNFLKHNQTGAGYSSNIDWNSTAGVSETIPTSGVVRVHIDGGAGGDVIVIGDPTVSASDLKVPFEIEGGGGGNVLILNSNKDTSGRTVTLTESVGDSYVSYSDGGLYQHGGFDGALLDLGEGSDVVEARGVDDLEPVVAYGNGGNDKLVAGTAGGGIGGIQGPVSLRGDAGTDTIEVNDAAGGGVYTINDAIRRGGASIAPGTGVENISLTTGAGNDAIYKYAGFPVRIAAGGGDDLISSRDPVADPVDCGTGNDFVLSDPLDALAASCETSDRQTATSGGTGGTGTQTPTDPQQPSDQPPAQPAPDTTAPTAAVTGVPKRIRTKTLLRGLKLKVATDEPSAVQVQLLGSTSTARLARSYNLTLGQASLPLGPGLRELKVKPNRRLVKRSRRFTVRVQVTVTDAAGNRSTVTRAVRVSG